jgi:hypothetical protein
LEAQLVPSGSFSGTLAQPKEAYFVKWDKETTTEFVMISLQQMAGQVEA